MGRARWAALTLQLCLLVVAVLLETTASFLLDSAGGSGVTGVLQDFAGPVLIVLLVLLFGGNVAVLWWENPRSSRPRWGGDRSPYPGLVAFSEADAAVFFGREQETADLVRRLHRLGVDARGRFVCVTGASGSGKSSLVHAGVVPRLRKNRWHVLPSLVPAGEPLGRLASLAASLGGEQREQVLRDLRTRREGLARILAAWRASSGNRHGRVLLVVDQMEELVTLSGPTERKLFLDQLLAALEADRRFWVLATLRVEFLADLLAGEHAGLLAAPVALGTVQPSEMTAIIERPAALVRMDFEPGLVAEIAEETETADALPLLAYLLQELYLAVGPNRTATHEAYRALGGVAGALTRQADSVFAELLDRYEPEQVLSTLLRLVTMEGPEATRRRVAVAELSADQQQIMEVFVDARLVTTSVADGEAYVQVAHEALFRQWAPLRQEVETRAEQLRRRAELERWAADWLRSGRSSDYLLTGGRLELATQWLEAIRSAGQDSPTAGELVEASRRRDAAHLRRVSESIGRHVLANVERYPELAVLLAAAAVTECGPTSPAGQALMSALAFHHGEAVLAGHREAVRHVAWSPDGRAVATASRDGTARVWDVQSGTVVHVLRDHTGMVEGVTWSPDSALVATASRDGTVRVWDAAAAASVTVLTCGDHVRAVAFSPDGTRLAATCRDRRVRVWDTATWAEPIMLVGHSGDVWGVHWAPDSRLLASASHDRTVVVWDADSGQPVHVLRGHLDLVEAVAFSPDGRWIATGSADRSVRIWDATTGSQHRSIGGYPEPVWSLTWTPDGDHLLFATGDTVRLWDVVRLRQLAVLRDHNHTTWSVAVSPEGTRAVTGSADSTARLWTLQPRGAERTQLVGHRAAVTAVAVDSDGTIATASADGMLRFFDPDGQLREPTRTFSAAVTALARTPNGRVTVVALQDGTTLMLNQTGHVHQLADGTEFECLALAPDGWRLAAGGNDNRIHLYDLRSRTLAGTLTGHDDWISTLAWSPSGRYLASGSDDRTARIWDMQHPGSSVVLSGHHNYVDGLTWAPDERTLASCSADWTVRLWDTTTGAALSVLAGHERRVRAVAFSPDGRHLATGGDDRTVRRWDLDNRSDEVIGVHRDTVTALTWLDDDNVLTASADNTARVWPARVDLDALTAAARARVTRDLTPEERRTHLLPSSE